MLLFCVCVCFFLFVFTPNTGIVPIDVHFQKIIFQYISNTNVQGGKVWPCYNTSVIQKYDNTPRLSCGGQIFHIHSRLSGISKSFKAFRWPMLQLFEAFRWPIFHNHLQLSGDLYYNFLILSGELYYTIIWGFQVTYITRSFDAFRWPIFHNHLMLSGDLYFTIVWYFQVTYISQPLKAFRWPIFHNFLYFQVTYISQSLKAVRWSIFHNHLRLSSDLYFTMVWGFRWPILQNRSRLLGVLHFTIICAFQVTYISQSLTVILKYRSPESLKWLWNIGHLKLIKSVHLQSKPDLHNINTHALVKIHWYFLKLSLKRKYRPIGRQIT